MKKTYQILLSVFILCALLISLGGCSKQADSNVAEIVPEDLILENIFLQWNLQSGQCLSWKFDTNGQCSYQAAGAQEVFCRYTFDGTELIIETDNQMRWTYDPYENCYWYSYEQDGQTYKSKIRAAQTADINDNALFYQYRTDNGTANVSTAVLYAKEITQAQTAIAAGDYEAAYRVLYAIEDKTVEVKELLSRFAFVPLSIVENNEAWDAANTEVYTYDSSGYLLKSEYTYSYGSWTTKIYTRDERGNALTEYETNDNGYETETSYTYNSKGDRLTSSDGYECSYSYDSNGNMITMTFKNPGIGFWQENSYTYDDNGNLLTERKKNSYGDVGEKSWTYDSNGNLLTHIDGFGELVEKVSYTYDNRGNKTSSYYEEGANWSKTVWTYDSANNMLSQEVTGKYGSPEKTTYTYDANGNLLTETEDGQHANTVTYTYDEFGNKTLETHDIHDEWIYTSSDSTITYTYQLFYYPNGVPEHIQYILVD